ncbi:MAG: hypothetical protein RI911_517 [Candidatus Parcubacteria bacterium]|jgi:hypothetical protein
MRYVPLTIFLVLLSAQWASAESARNQKYGIVQDKEPVTSHVAEMCEQWTKARKSACKDFSKKLKEQYNMTTPFPLIEKQKQQELTYRLALEGDTPQKGEQLLVCEKNTVQDVYRLSGLDDISVQDPTEKLLTPDEVVLAKDGTRVKKLSKAEAKKKQQSYVLLADGESDVKGKKGCMLEKDIKQKYGKGCARPKGETGKKEDPKTCRTGLTVIRGVPFSDEAIQNIKGSGIECFKEERGRVKKNQRTEIAERISLASYVFCSDDAEKMKQATQKDRDKKEGDPDKDIREDLTESSGEVFAALPERSSEMYRSRVSGLVKGYVMGDTKDNETLKEIFEESKNFGEAFLKEATKSAVQTRIRDYKDQLARKPESRAHSAALYGGLCGLGQKRYCNVKIKQ